MPAGPPIGNTNASKGKPWRDAINWALENYEKEGKVARNMALREIALKMIENALEGKQDAVKELGDRIDGKPAQAIVGDPEQPLQVSICKMMTESDENS